MKKLLWFIALLTPVGLSAQTGTVTDIDSNEYTTHVYNTTEWMTENLRTTRLNNGDSIPLKVCEDTVWAASEVGEYPAYCFYNDSVENGEKYGLLYNWSAAADTGICPEGWHLPDTADWLALAEYIVGSENYDCEMGRKNGTVQSVGSMLKSSDLWKSSTTSGTNDSSFNALPAGHRHVVNASCCGGGCSLNKTTTGYMEMKETAQWWTPNYVHSSQYGTGRWYIGLNYDEDNLTIGSNDNYNAKSIRCIRYVESDTSSDDTLTDNNNSSVMTLDESQFEVYPSVVLDKFSVSLTGVSGSTFSLLVYNMNGEAVLKQTVHNGTNIVSLRFEPAGMYVVRLVDGTEILATEKVLKK